MSVLPDPLPLKDTTPVTEAVENSFDEATRSIRDISHELQSAISIASKNEQGSFEKFVVQTGRLGLALLHGYISAWSSAVDGLGLVAADEADWWWTPQLEPPFAVNDPRHGVLRASATTIPHGKPIPPQWIRVARRTGNGQFTLIDRGVGVPTNWDGTCYVSVRQYDNLAPGTVRITFRMVNASGHTIASTIKKPIDAVLSM